MSVSSSIHFCRESPCSICGGSRTYPNHFPVAFDGPAVDLPAFIELFERMALGFLPPGHRPHLTVVVDS